MTMTCWYCCLGLSLGLYLCLVQLLRALRRWYVGGLADPHAAYCHLAFADFDFLYRKALELALFRVCARSLAQAQAHPMSWTPRGGLPLTPSYTLASLSPHART